MISRSTKLGLIAAAVIAASAQEAAACSWAHAPEPVGDTAALYIGGRMMDAAAWVDVAEAESAAPLATPSGPHPFVKSVTFRVVERLKGRSPERFSLFAMNLKELGDETRATQLMHWVDEKTGVVYPFSTPWEPSPAWDMSISTCDPGFIEPVRGRRYLVFRGADGGLLGPVSFVADQRPTHGFSFVEADTPPDGAWNRIVRLISARRAADPGFRPPPAEEPPPAIAADPTRASVSFRRLLSDEEVRALLEGAGAQPYAVYSRLGVHRLGAEAAPGDAVAAARAHVLETLGPDGPSGGIVARARHALEGVTREAFAADADKVAYARALVGAQVEHAARVAAVRGGAPIIYGVEFVGGPAVQAALARSAMVHAVRPAIAVRGRSVAPDPENLAARAEPPSTPREVAALTATELYARLQALAASTPAPGRPRPPSPPR